MSAKTEGRGVEKSTHLTTQVALAEGMIDRETGKLWPTPNANHQQGGPTGLNGGSGARKKVHDMVGREEALKMTGGQLNPTWVEWLMGFPIGWTDLED